MSTPYVGLKQVTRFSPFEGNSSWLDQDPAVSPEETIDNRYQSAKQDLLHLLEHEFGIEAIDIGMLRMRLTEVIPDRHLMKATQYLLEQLRLEAKPSKHLASLEHCLQRFLHA